MSTTADRGYLERNDSSRGRLVRLLDRLTEEDLGRAVDGWSVATNLAHLAFWDRFLAVRWEEAATSGRARPLDLGAPLFDLINEALAPQWALLDLAALRVLAAGAAATIDAHVAGLPDETIAAVQTAGLGRMLDRSLHRDDHLDAIEAVLG